MIHTGYKTVTVVSSPITTRYVNPGDEGQIDETKTPQQIRVNGVWFDFDDKRWIVVTENEKEEMFIEALKEHADEKYFLTDRIFNELIEEYDIKKEQAMQWMLKDGMCKIK